MAKQTRDQEDPYDAGEAREGKRKNKVMLVKMGHQRPLGRH